jgi:hypothetical protein
VGGHAFQHNSVRTNIRTRANSNSSQNYGARAKTHEIFQSWRCRYIDQTFYTQSTVLPNYTAGTYLAVPMNDDSSLMLNYYMSAQFDRVRDLYTVIVSTPSKRPPVNQAEGCPYNPISYGHPPDAESVDRYRPESGLCPIPPVRVIIFRDNGA